MISNEKFFERIDEAFEKKTAKDYNRIVQQYITMLDSVQAKMNTAGMREAKRYYELQQAEWKRWVKENVDSKVNISPIEDFGKVTWKRAQSDTQQSMNLARHKLVGMLKK
ncbi:hypothetical protein ZPAH1_orf00059 [Aeromonas phage ZPAH1]|nr:hypothetical protein ZPAH1_orf00059 [Aeromonas phage ZPAH1]